MSNYLLVGETSVSIPQLVNEQNVIFYLIIVKVGEDISWEVKRRYSEFITLHEQLAEEGVQRDVQLPPKKLLGNKDPVFLLKRRKDLEAYLQSTFHFLARNLPDPLAEFLHFAKYDVHFVLKTLASEAYQRELDVGALSLDEDTTDSTTSSSGFSIVSSITCTNHQPSPPSTPTSDPTSSPNPNPISSPNLNPVSDSNYAFWTPLEMFSISQRLQHPCPPTDPDSKRYDFTNVVDECCRLDGLQVTGCADDLGSSNINLNKLQFDFLAFKSLSRLRLENLSFDPGHLTSLGMLRSTLKELTVVKSGIKTISEILLCDTPHDPADLDLSNLATWTNLLHLDLSDNSIEGLDRCIRLAPAIETLVLDNNTIDSLDNLTGLPRLRRLSLVNNNIILTQDLHTVLGQITHIDLSHNNLSSLLPFKKLYSLQDLNVSWNKVSELEEVFIVCSLPCLDTINLENNTVTSLVDYRLKTLEGIGARCREVRLDGELPTQGELDKVSVLMALRVTREKRCPTSLFGNLPNSEQWKH
jgi:hypothetical protein